MANMVIGLTIYGKCAVEDSGSISTLLTNFTMCRNNNFSGVVNLIK